MPKCIAVCQGGDHASSAEIHLLKSLGHIALGRQEHGVKAAKCRYSWRARRAPPCFPFGPPKARHFHQKGTENLPVWQRKMLPWEKCRVSPVTADSPASAAHFKPYGDFSCLVLALKFGTSLGKQFSDPSEQVQAG